MADVRTHLRELSVATTIGLLNLEIEFNKSDLYDSQRFLAYAKKIISGDISSANNLCRYKTFTGELQQIVDNGYKLGKKIFESPHFIIEKDAKIQWLGNDTQKGDPIDITVGDYEFSLKEESFILKNMGLYTLLNNLTGSNYAKGLHVFSTFASDEYDKWFDYTWCYLINYIRKNGSWTLYKNSNISFINIIDNKVVLSYNAETSIVPIDISTNSEYMHYTTSKIREKVFAKWINDIISNDANYIKYKKICSETAGKAVSDKINNEFQIDNIYEFFQIYVKEYYYAKTTSAETTILRVPSCFDFNSVIEFQGCYYNVPSSQLNIITKFQNRHTGKYLEFRNECRFSHGQFNGTPEAKMYVVKDTPLFDLYEPLD